MTELIYTLIVTHITIVCVTVFLHRGQAHRGLEFNPILSHFMRFWLWLTTGMVTKEWVAVHRKHHRFCEQEGDPHSPFIFGIRKVFFTGACLYNTAAKDKEMVQQYGVGTPDDWVERNIYSKYPWLGILIMMWINCLLFRGLGIFIWIVQMVWIPLWAAGFINGIGHWWGYRNGQTSDNSRNIVPFGIIVGGEELHNNHHLSPASPKLSSKWYEFDIGWMYIRIFSMFRLLTVRNSP
jgi:stearoyl-CoA desaturase (delta-9 desaturase)